MVDHVLESYVNNGRKMRWTKELYQDNVCDDLTDVSKIVKLCILWDTRKARKSATTWIINIGSKK